MPEYRVLDLRATAALPNDVARGLLAYVSFTVCGLRIDGITLRRTRNGALTLSFPTRKKSGGQPRQIVRPVSSEIRDSLMRRTLAELQLPNGDTQIDAPDRGTRS